MNYELIESEFDQILYLIINKKVGNTSEKEEYLKRYKDIVKNLILLIQKIESPAELPQKSHPLPKRKHVATEKDRIRADLF